MKYKPIQRTLLTRLLKSVRNEDMPVNEATAEILTFITDNYNLKKESE